MEIRTTLPGIELGPGVWTDREQLRFGFSRSSGPGGQNVNKVNTKTELRVGLRALHGMSERALGRLKALAGRRVVEDDLLFYADRERTQESNRRACLEKLRELIVAALVEPKVRRKSKPSKGAKQRRLESKKRQGAKKKERGWREGA